MKLLDLSHTRLLSIHRKINDKVLVISAEIDNIIHRNEVKSDTFDGLRADLLAEQSKQFDLLSRLDFERSNHLVRANDLKSTPLPYRNSAIELEIQNLEYRRGVAYQLISRCVWQIKNCSASLQACQKSVGLSDDQIIELVDRYLANINKHQTIQINTLGSISHIRTRLSQLYAALLTNNDSHKSRWRSGFLRLKNRKF